MEFRRFEALRRSRLTRKEWKISTAMESVLVALGDRVLHDGVLSIDGSPFAR
jgi:hypothetical protein